MQPALVAMHSVAPSLYLYGDIGGGDDFSDYVNFGDLGDYGNYDDYGHVDRGSVVQLVLQHSQTPPIGGLATQD